MFQYINYNFLKNRENQVHTPISVDLFRENIKQYTAKMGFFLLFRTKAVWREKYILIGPKTEFSKMVWNFLKVHEMCRIHGKNLLWSTCAAKDSSLK